jgi:hypothetical protein
MTRRVVNQTGANAKHKDSLGGSYRARAVAAEGQREKQTADPRITRMGTNVDAVSATPVFSFVPIRAHSWMKLLRCFHIDDPGE